MTPKPTREQLAKILDDLPEETLEDLVLYVDFLRNQIARRESSLQNGSKRMRHPAAGIWADRLDITDVSTYSLALRRSIEAKHDGKLQS